MAYHVLSLRPGMHRGGRANPQHAEYAEGDHTPAQFHDLVADPNIVVITGGERMTAEHVAALHVEEAAKAKKTEGKKA